VRLPTRTRAGGKLRVITGVPVPGKTFLIDRIAVANSAESHDGRRSADGVKAKLASRTRAALLRAPGLGSEGPNRRVELSNRSG
jgi:hypothetical protein